MQVCNVIVESAVVLEGIGTAICIVEEVQGVAAVGFPEKLITGIVISVDNSINGFRQSLTIGIVGEFNLGVSGGCLVQLLPRAPGEGPPGAVIVAGGIADSGAYSYYTSYFPTPQEKKPWNHKDSRVGLLKARFFLVFQILHNVETFLVQSFAFSEALITTHNRLHLNT